MRRVSVGAGLILAVLICGAGAFLWEAHWEMRGISPPLPEPDTLEQRARVADAPVRVSYVNTATQRGSGPAPLGHPGFLLEWSDGRVFLIDVGMTPEQAVAFGRPMEWLLGAEPSEPHGSLAEQLGAAVERIEGIGFTHLHNDHTGGLASLCAALGRPVPVFQTPQQFDFENYTTRWGRRDLEEAGCARPLPVEGGPLFPVPGFPGLLAQSAGGHTPGSTIYVARVGDTTWVFAGDVTNFMESLRLNRPKPRFYSLFIVPENLARLDVLRRWLADLNDRPGVEVVPSHDLDRIVESGISPAG